MRAAAIAMGIGLTAGCGSVSFPDRAPAIEGEIVGIGDSVPFSRGNAGTIWVKEDVTDECGIVFNTSGAEIGERGLDGSVRSRNFDDLVTGLRVRVWTTNIADSCPGQAGATEIEIVGM